MFYKRIYHIIVFLFLLLILDCQQSNNSKDLNEHPTIYHHQNFSSQYVSPRNVDVMLPPGYADDPTRKYPILLMHDGQMLFDSTTTWNHQEWGVDETIEKLIAEQKIPPIIVVGVWNTEKRFVEYLPQQPAMLFPDSTINTLRGFSKTDVQSDLYLRFLTTELLPFLETEYRIAPGKENHYIAGSSMGGLISLYAICQYPDIFGGAACLSTHWPVAFDNNHPELAQTLIAYFGDHLPDPKNHKIYFDYGTETLDSLYQPHQEQMDAQMAARGYVQPQNWLTKAFPGADHSESAWNARLNIPLEFLFGK